MRTQTLLLFLLCAIGLTPVSQAQDLYDRTVVRTLELQFAVSDWHQQLNANKATGLQQYLDADMTVDGVLYPDVGVRYKGNSTYWSIPPGQKKPMNIDLREFGIDQNLYGQTKLVLNNQSFDPSIMREVVAYRVMNQFIPAPRACFIKVVINGDNYGIYSLIEHIGDPFCESRFGSADGFRYKSVPPWSWPDTLDPPPHPDDLALQDIGGSLLKAERAYQLKNRETDPDRHLGILDAIDGLNFTQPDLLVQTLEPLLDTDLAMWHLALNNVLCSLDAYYSTGQNYYLYQDPIHGRLAILPWDFNMAFGIYGNSPTDLSPTAGKGETDRPLLSKLVKAGVLRQEYLSHIHAAATQGLVPQTLHAEIDAMAALIEAEVQADTRLGVTHAEWLAGVQNLKDFIQDRHDFLITHSLIDVERPGFLSAGHWPAQPTSAERVTFWAEVANPADPVESVLVNLRVVGGFQQLELFDDGLHGDGAAGDGIFAASTAAFPFASKVDYYFRAKCQNSNGVSFLPERASTAPLSFVVGPGTSYSDVVINEFVARNQSGVVDEAGQYEDWIELHNRGSNTVDLSGMWLSDNLEAPLKWQIPTGYSLAPGETILIWADADAIDGPLHANFKLSSGGEDLVLIAADGITLLDFQIFGAQLADTATGRLDDGGDLWMTLPAPTPNLSNQIDCGARAYNALDHTQNVASLSLAGTPSPGATVQLNLANFPAQQGAKIAIGTSAQSIDYPTVGLTSLVGNPLAQLFATTDATGSAVISYQLPSNASLVGQRFYMQAGVLGAASVASNGVEVVVCP
jgi:hypothetical protein